MANQRSYLRSRGGKEDFAEISWTRRAIEIVEGARGTPGKSRERIFEREADVEDELRRETERLIDEGFVEYTGDVPLRLDPVEHVVQTAQKNHQRVCAVPVFSQGDARPGGSRRGGIPWLVSGEPWPRCSSCRKELRFVMQLALAEVKHAPSPLPREGLLQVFTCDKECFLNKGYEAFSGANLVRVIDATNGCVAILPELADSDADFLVPERVIESLDFVPDCPRPEELAALLDVDFDHALDGWKLLKEKKLTDRWEKVGGWPRWVHEEESVACRECGARMTYAMQLEESLRELALPYGNTLFVMCCSSCGEMTAVQQA